MDKTKVEKEIEVENDKPQLIQRSALIYSLI